jgi:hypothetical protein
MWVDETIYGALNKNATVQLNVEQRFIDDISEFAYLHIEPTLRFRIKKENYFSLQALQLWGKVSHQNWISEFEPEFTLNNTITTKHVDFFSRTQLLYRWQEVAKSHGAFRFRPGITIFKKPYLTIYAQHEFLYNYHNLQGIDETRFSAGLKGTIEKNFSWNIYFLHRDNKTAPGANRKGTNVLGVALTIHT